MHEDRPICLSIPWRPNVATAVEGGGLGQGGVPIGRFVSLRVVDRCVPFVGKRGGGVQVKNRRTRIFRTNGRHACGCLSSQVGPAWPRAPRRRHRIVGRDRRDKGGISASWCRNPATDTPRRQGRRYPSERDQASQPRIPEADAVLAKTWIQAHDRPYRPQACGRRIHWRFAATRSRSTIFRQGILPAITRVCTPRWR